MSLDKRSIELGTEGWGVKEDNLLAFRKDRTRYVEKPFTFSRGTAATRVNSSGLVEILHDEATNLITHSNEFDNASSWSSTSLDFTSSQSGYDGSNDAYLIERTDVNSHLRQSISSGNILTISIYAKANTLNWIRIRSAAVENAYFNLDPSYSGNRVGYTQNIINANIEDVGNGWFRCSVVTGFYDRAWFYPAIDNNDVSGVSGSIYIQNSQAEIGYVATPYIETTTQAVTQPNKHETPRISYDIVDGVVSDKPHLLLEPARTNIITYSEDFSNAYWSSTTDVVLENGYLSPDGSNNAYKVTKNGTNAKVAVVVSGTAAPYSKSIYARTLSGSGTAYLGEGSISGVGVLSTITEQWQRFEISVNTNNFYPVDFRGESTLTEVLIWGAQMEQGSYATSYIPNHGNTSGVTRAAETAENCGAAQDFNDDEGVLFAEIKKEKGDDGVFRLLSLGDSNDFVSIGFNNTQDKIFARIKATTTIFTHTSVMSNPSDYHRIAVNYKSENSAVWINGIELSSYNNTFNFANPLDEVTFDYAGSGLDFYGRLKELKVYTENLNDAELRLLTKYAPSDYDAAFTADYVDNLAEFTVLRTEATDKLYYSISDGTNSVSGSATIIATQVTISNIDISSLSDGTLTLSVYIEDERKQRGVTVTDTTIKDTTNTPLYSYALQQRATGATFEDLDNSESIIESLNVEV